MSPPPPKDFETLKRWKILLKRELAKLEQTSLKTGTLVGGKRNALWLQQIGESIAAAADTIAQGVDRAEIKNIHTGKTETISLNPKLSANENAALYLKKAKKTERTEANAIAVSDDVSRKHRILDEAIRRISSHSSSSGQQEIAMAIADAAKAVATVLPGFDAEETIERQDFHYRRFSVDGWSIFIGKDDRQNDELSIRFAAPADLWFHVAGHAGSHGIIRRPKGSPMPPRRVINIAAALVAWFSKARNAPSVEVHWTEARYVHKRRGSPVGEVTVERWKAIHVIPQEPERLGKE